MGPVLQRRVSAPPRLRLALAAAAALFGAAARGSDSTVHLPPTRPGAPSAPPALAPPPAGAPHWRPSLRLTDVDYVEITEIAVGLGCKGTWLEPRRRLKLVSKSDPATTLELEAEKRQVLVDGLRLDLGHPVVYRGSHLYVSRTDLEHVLVALLQPAAAPDPPPAPRVIVIDPGHGGDDPGMENKRLGLQEKTLTLDVSLRLQKLLEAAGYRVVLTRSDARALSADKKKDLLLRAEVANRAGADLFVSVHFNSLYPDTKTSGTEIFVYTPPGERSSESWGFAKPDDSRRDAEPVNRHDAWSAVLAQSLHREVIGRLHTVDRGLKTKHLLAFQDLNCPAALVESVFLSNEIEARKAATPAFRQQIAEALAAGIADYAATVGRLPGPALERADPGAPGRDGSPPPAR